MTIKNNRGNVSLMGASFTGILSLFLLFLVLKMQIEYQEAKYRKNSYLCMKYLVTKTNNYVSEMTKLNWSLRAAYIAQSSVVASEEAIIVFKGLVLYRNALHLSYVKNLISNNYCTYPESRDFVKNLPYQTKSIFILDTLIDETSKLRNAEWTNLITIFPKRIRANHQFTLSIHYSMENPFLPKLKYSSKEVGKMGLLSLSHSYGSLSSRY